MKNQLLLTTLFAFTLCTSQENKVADWSSDLDYLKTELPKRHYSLFAIKSPSAFEAGIEKIKKQQWELSDFAIAFKLQQLIAGFGDSHSKVSWGQYLDKSQILPLHLVWFSDGIYILHTTEENQQVLGNRIISLNGFTIETLTDSLSSLITIDNQALLKNFIPKLLPLVQVLKHFGFAREETVSVELEDLKGKTKTYFIKPAYMDRMNRKMVLPGTLPLCYKNERAFFVDYYQGKDKIYYLQYNKCWSRELAVKYENGKNAHKLPSFTEFEEKVFGILQNKEVEKLVFDMRFNGGGNSEQGTEFISKIADFQKQNPDLRIYVVLGRQTFSSAILNAMDFANMTVAIFVGEDTGGKPNHFGEVKSFRLPNSGLKVSYSTKYFKRTDKDVNTLSPDIPIESSFRDFKEGIDPVYEWIKKQ